MSLINVNGTRLPTPSVYRVSRQDLDSANSGRNERGILLRDRVREGVIKVELEWRAINNSQATLIINAVKPSKMGVTLLVEGRQQSFQMYRGDIKSELIRYMDSTNKMAWNVSFNLIEF